MYSTSVPHLSCTLTTCFTGSIFLTTPNSCKSSTIFFLVSLIDSPLYLPDFSFIFPSLFKIKILSFTGCLFSQSKNCASPLLQKYTTPVPNSGSTISSPVISILELVNGMTTFFPISLLYLLSLGLTVIPTQEG